RRYEIQLVFDGQHRAVGWKQRVARVAAGRIDQRRQNTRVHVTVLLAEFRPRRERDRTVPRLHLDQLGADQRHRTLAPEALADALGEAREGRDEDIHWRIIHWLNTARLRRLGHSPPRFCLPFT